GVCSRAARELVHRGARPSFQSRPRASASLYPSYMRMTCFVVAALALASVSSLHAQRRFRLGPMLSSLSLEDASGTGHGFTAWGGTAALITGDAGETGLTVARYGDLA